MFKCCLLITDECLASPTVLVEKKASINCSARTWLADTEETAIGAIYSRRGELRVERTCGCISVMTSAPRLKFEQCLDDKFMELRNMVHNVWNSLE